MQKRPKINGYDEQAPARRLIVHAKRLAEEISADRIREEILELRRTFQELGEELFPDIHVKIAQMAVSHAARSVLSEQELEEVRERNRTTGGQRGATAHMPEGYEKNGGTEPVEKKTKWTDAEMQRLRALTLDPSYCYPSGMHKDRPCFEMICDVLNREFHDGAHIRNTNSCHRKYKRLPEESQN